MKRNKIILVSLIITFCIAIFWFIFSSDLKGVIQSDSEPIHHYIFTEVLKGNIDENGMVNYNGVFEKKDKLDEYLSLLSSHHPNISWTKKEQKAYWINAYNAFTIQLVLNNYPLKSIKDLGGIIYRVNTSWDIEFIEIEGQLYDLNDIEHKLLRAVFNSKEFWATSNRGALIKSPIELTIGTLRALPYSVRRNNLAHNLNIMGQGVFSHPSVKGWEGGKNWISTQSLLRRNSMMTNLTRGNLNEHKYNSALKMMLPNIPPRELEKWLLAIPHLQTPPTEPGKLRLTRAFVLDPAYQVS